MVSEVRLGLPCCGIDARSEIMAIRVATISLVSLLTVSSSIHLSATTLQRKRLEFHRHVLKN
jgi:hypothetical protein